MEKKNGQYFKEYAILCQSLYTHLHPAESLPRFPIYFAQRKVPIEEHFYQGLHMGAGHTQHFYQGLWVLGTRNIFTRDCGCWAHVTFLPGTVGAGQAHVTFLPGTLGAGQAHVTPVPTI